MSTMAVFCILPSDRFDMDDKTIYLGTNANPKPVFRADNPDAFDWPNGAVMAVEFRDENFPGVGPHRNEQLPLVEFYGEDGWPLALLPGLKSVLSETIRRELQVFHWGWRHWQPSTWSKAQHFPDVFAKRRTQQAPARRIVEAYSPSAP